MKAINVLIVEDHKLTARLLANLIGSVKEIHVAGIAFDGEESLDILSKKQVDIVLLDLVLPNTVILELMNDILRNVPGIKIIILSTITEAWVIQKTIKAGASGFLTKYAKSEDVIDAILTVHKGGIYFCRTSVSSLMKDMNYKESKPEGLSALKKLTNRESEILDLISQELTTNEISERLSLSPRTIETHRKNLMRKLGVKNTVGLIIAAMNANLLKENEHSSIN